MKAPVLRFACLALIFLSGCQDRKGNSYENITQNGKETIVRKIYDKDGGLLKEIQLNKDSVRDGSYKEYQAGRIRCLGHFDADVRDSTWSYYDSAGQIVKKENWFAGKEFGEQLVFNDSGNRAKPYLSWYAFNNLDGGRIFSLLLDPSSRVISAKGAPLYTAYNKDTIRAGSDFELMYFFGVPATFSYVMQVSEYDVAAKKQTFVSLVSDTSQKLEKLSFARKYMQIKTYPKTGVYDWTVHFVLKDSLNKVLVNDTSTTRVSVK